MKRNIGAGNQILDVRLETDEIIVAFGWVGFLLICCSGTGRHLASRSRLGFG